MQNIDWSAIAIGAFVASTICTQVVTLALVFRHRAEEEERLRSVANELRYSIGDAKYYKVRAIECGCGDGRQN